MKYLVAIAFLALGACTSLPTKVADIRQGMSKEDVTAQLGQPAEFVTNENGELVWAFKHKRDVCAVGFKDDVVTSTACTKDPNYKSRAGAFFKGFSNGMAQAQSNRKTCTPNGIGGYVCQ